MCQVTAVPGSVQASSLSSVAFVMGSGLQGGSIVEGLTGQASGGRDLPSERAEVLRSEVPGKGTRRVRTQAFQSGQWVTL